mmetsp:Transcript_97225/g.145680  ORF Transcript_97225/g.145680 Transcript_97225/m.145680 type:complete len:300 (-) Transcript_97225:71-970(-)
MTTKAATSNPTIAHSAASLPVSAEEFELTATLIDADSLYLDKPVKALDARYSSLANLRKELTWTDNFFEDEDDVIAVFDFDYDAMESFYTSVGWVTLASSIIYTPIFVCSLLGLAPCYLRKNIRWSTRSQHVAITQDGIRFVRERRPCCWGLQCTDQGKSSKTVPFDKITDCDIEEPAGNTCFCITNVLSTVNVDTASSGTEGKKELKLAGLKDPHSFKKLVWAMKRAQQQGSTMATAASIPVSDKRLEVAGTDKEVAMLLREIRDELRINNELLQNKQPCPEKATPPAGESEIREDNN